MVDQTKKLGINAAQSLEKRNNNHSNERQDLINCHFKSVGVCVCIQWESDERVWQWLLLCGGVCVWERKKDGDWEGREGQGGIEESCMVNALCWHKNEMMRLKDWHGLGDADDTFCLSFVSQSAGAVLAQ